MKPIQILTLVLSPLIFSASAVPQRSKFDDAVAEVKATYPGISDADATTAAWGYIEAQANMAFDAAKSKSSELVWV